jgi:signal transduction histidine kinase
MTDMTTVPSDELAHLKERARKLAQDKSYLQLIINLMNNVSAASGLDDAVDCMLRSIIEIVGGANITLYYSIGNGIFLVDVFGRKAQLDSIDDHRVQQVFDSREAIESEHDFSDTRMMTPEFTKAHTWIYPLLVGQELIAVLKMESLQIDRSELNNHLPTFFNFAALVLKNNRETEALHLKTAELEEEVAERQMAQENLQEKALLLEEEIEKRQSVQNELEKLNEKLEQRVQDRTAELNERNAEVQQAYDDLKKVQGQLLQQDKMASIGQLAAGVAHEINNPMGFIISNLGSLGRYVEKLAAYLDANEEVLAGCDPAIRLRADQGRQKFKIDHIRKDMPDLITESSEGAQRIRQIVLDLKSFSRVDGVEFANADINEGLESTLSIAWNELKYKSTVTRDYGQLPLVWCNLGQLNQVFLNILVNAAHAIEEKGEIRIATREEDGSVRIAISDTGVGIQPENLKRIFDPFFTTKEVGKGTGLGLSIAYDIVVNKHGGSIGVESEIGTGTTFTIMLPIRAE